MVVVCSISRSLKSTIKKNWLFISEMGRPRGSRRNQVHERGHFIGRNAHIVSLEVKNRNSGLNFAEKSIMLDKDNSSKTSKGFSTSRTGKSKYGVIDEPMHKTSEVFLIALIFYIYLLIVYTSEVFMDLSIFLTIFKLDIYWLVVYFIIFWLFKVSFPIW